MSDAIGYECQMMGHPMDKIRVLVKGHNDLSNMIDLRGIGESLMNDPVARGHMLLL